MITKINLTFKNLTDFYITQINKQPFFDQEYQEFSKNEYLKLKTIKNESWYHKDNVFPRQFKYSVEFDYKKDESEISHTCYFMSISISEYETTLFNEFKTNKKNDVYNYVILYARELHDKYINNNLSDLNYDDILPICVEESVNIDDINSMLEDNIKLKNDDINIPKISKNIVKKDTIKKKQKQ